MPRIRVYSGRCTEHGKKHVYDTPRQMDSMWLFAIKAFEVNKLRLFNILFSHFGSLCTLLSRWNVRMDAKGPKDGAQCKDRGCERKKAVNLNGSMLATELKQRSRVDSKHTHTMHMINQKRTKCERQWQWQKRAPNLWMCSIFLSLSHILSSTLKIKLKLTKRLMLKRRLMCIVCVFCRLSTKSKHVPFAFECMRWQNDSEWESEWASGSMSFYENVLYRPSNVRSRFSATHSATGTHK